MSEDDRLYDIDINTPVSPAELKRFTELLERHGYTVVTDLGYGKIRIEGTEGAESTSSE